MSCVIPVCLYYTSGLAFSNSIQLLGSSYAYTRDAGYVWLAAAFQKQVLAFLLCSI